jgi:hypothetical protein
MDSSQALAPRGKIRSSISLARIGEKMEKFMRSGGAVGACLALVVAAELFCAWCAMSAPRDEPAVATVSYSKEPQACSDQSAWFVCGP